jgi:hypothetical protein
MQVGSWSPHLSSLWQQNHTPVLHGVLLLRCVHAAAVAVLCLCLQGDSGFVVVRGGQIVLRSSPKQHFFDCPLQFGSYPEHVDDTDTADDAEVYQLPVLPGDVIIAGG